MQQVNGEAWTGDIVDDFVCAKIKTRKQDGEAHGTDNDERVGIAHAYAGGKIGPEIYIGWKYSSICQNWTDENTHEVRCRDVMVIDAHVTREQIETNERECGVTEK